MRKKARNFACLFLYPINACIFFVSDKRIPFFPYPKSACVFLFYATKIARSKIFAEEKRKNARDHLTVITMDCG